MQEMVLHKLRRCRQLNVPPCPPPGEERERAEELQEVLQAANQQLAQNRAASEQLAAALQQEQQVISSRLYAGQTIVHVVSEGQPGPDYEPVIPSLEDVYFARIAEAERGAAVVA